MLNKVNELNNANVQQPADNEKNVNDIVVTNKKRDKDYDKERSNDESLFTKDVIIESKSVDNNELLIKSLKEEITFLRNEILSKDKIIELILTQPRNIVETNVNKGSDFMAYDKTFKYTKNKSGKNVLALRNRFTAFNQPVCNSDMNLTHDLINESSCQKHDKEDENDIIGSRKSKKRTMNFVGDSILKDLRSHQLKNKLNKHDKLYVQSYRGGGGGVSGNFGYEASRERI